MKIIKLSIEIFVLFIFANCGTANYLPYHYSLDSNPYGSYIFVKTIKNKSHTGELISSTNSSLLILEKINRTKVLITLPKIDIKRYNIIYANKSDARVLPIIVSLSHGWFSPLTMLINGIVSFNTDFSYSNKNLKYSELKMFARFPQGIPENIDVQKIK